MNLIVKFYGYNNTFNANPLLLQIYSRCNNGKKYVIIMSK